MHWTVQDVTLECVTGDIASQSDVSAVVNAANAELRSGGGVAGALHRKAGPGLEAECRRFAPIRPGQAVLTGGHDLPNRYVIHTLGPVYGVDEPGGALLADCYRESLRLAEQHHIDSIAFPAISTGAFGYPMDEAARTAAHTIREAAPGLVHLRLIRFVLLREHGFRVHVRAFDGAIIRTLEGDDGVPREP